MASLKNGETRHNCEYEEHSEIRSQKSYIVRSYYNELEKHFCQGCLAYMERLGVVKYGGMAGWQPNNTSVETLISVYGS